MGILSYLHKRAKAKHTKLSQRLAKNLRTGRFEELTPKRKNKVLSRLEKRRAQLSRLTLLLAIATGAAISSGQAQVIVGPQQAEGLGPFNRVIRENNPLRAPIQMPNGYYFSSNLADIDGDGDVDLYHIYYAEGNEYLYVQKNLQSDLGLPQARFSEPVYLNIGYISGFGDAFISFIDADGDLDLDMYIGRNSSGCGPSSFFRNEGGINSDLYLSQFVDNTYTVYNIFNPPIGTNSGEKITSVDIDDDGDLDFFVGTNYSNVLFLKNDPPGTLTDYVHSFNSIGLESARISFIDIDQDGDMDAFIGETYGTIHFYKNGDIEENGVIDNDNLFIPDDANPLNPFNGVRFGRDPEPQFVDIDMDGDKDIVVGFYDFSYFPDHPLYPSYQGSNWRTFINDGSYNFSEVLSPVNPFGGVDVYINAAPNLVDIDQDGDLDAFIGSYYGKIHFFKNEPEGFTQQFGLQNPMDHVDLGMFVTTKPEFADTDNDGDLDAYVGSKNAVSPYFFYYKNIGTPLVPDMELTYDPGNSLFQKVQSAITSFTSTVFPSIEDIDGDGDLDALVGGIYSYGYCSPQFHYFFENQVSPPSPPPVNTPADFDYGINLNGVTFDGNDVGELTDLDHDGDLDIIRQLQSGEIRTFVNDGSLNFTEYLGSNTGNHLFEINGRVGGESVMDIVDFDNDGDLDVFVGNTYGQIHMFENTNLPPDVSISGGNVTFVEDAGPVLVDDAISTSETEFNPNTHLAGAVFTINGYVNGEDQLSFTDLTNIKGKWDASSGRLTLTGKDLVGEYHLALQSVTYSNLGGDNPTPSPRSISIEIRDTDWTDPSSIPIRPLVVTAINDPPVLSPVTANTATEDILLTFTGSVTDPDDANNGTDLTWSLVGAPAGMTVSTTGTVSWTPTEGILTSGPVTLKVTDSGGLFSEQSFTIAVTPVNDPPSITSTAGTTATEGSLYTYTPTVVDPDDANDGTNLTWSLSGQPAGMIVSTTGVVSWTPPDGVATSGAVTLTVQDGGENGAAPFSEVFTITIATVNNPPQLTLNSTVASYIENSVPVLLDNLAVVTDPDVTNVSFGITASITNFQNGEDVLAATSAGSVTGTFDNATGILTITGTGSVAQFQTVLRSATYQNTSDDPITTSRNIDIIVDDGTVQTTPQTINVLVSAVNDAPVISGAGTALNHTMGISTIDNSVAASDADDTDLVTAQVAITSGFKPGTDLLAFSPQGSITGSYNSSTGVLDLSGSGTIAEYNAVLQSVTYENTLGLDISTRTVQFFVNDGSDNSNIFSRTINVDISDLPPSLALTSSTFSYTENAGSVSIDPGISITDDSPSITGGVIAITTNFTPGVDILGFTDQSGITGTFDPLTGILTLSGSASAAEYETAIASLTYENTSEDPGALTKSVEIQLDDGTNTSPAVTLDIQITPVNDAPQLAGASTALSYRSLTGSVVVDNLITVTDPDNTGIDGAVISVATNYSSGEDILGFTNQNGITGSFSTITGALSLSGTASKANYQTALRSITYRNTAPVPSASTKSISFVISDVSTSSNAITRSIQVASNQVVAASITTQVDLGTNATIDVIGQATFTAGDLITTTITGAPTRGTAVVNPDGSILYTPNNNNADGNTDQITYELCNQFVSCGTNTINVTINNSAPVINIAATLIQPGGRATVSLLSGITDQNGNIDQSSVRIIDGPTSGLPATIDSDLNLTIDYSGSGFTGADHILIEVCDFSGACTQFDIVIIIGDVEEVTIYQGVTPNNDGINDVLKILDVEFFPNNEMFIYNRIGKLVYNVKGYDNFGVVFSGFDDQDNELPDGTYFYVIVLEPGNRQSGYIVLQR